MSRSTTFKVKPTMLKDQSHTAAQFRQISLFQCYLFNDCNSLVIAASEILSSGKIEIFTTWLTLCCCHGNARKETAINKRETNYKF